MISQNEQNEGLFVNFPEKGVVIFVPPQVVSKKMELVEIKSPDDLLADYDDFTFIREVINFKVVDEDKEELTSFTPPMELTVLFNSEELEIAREKEKSISLAYRDKKDKYWNRFTKVKHFLETHLINDPLWAGLFKVKISEWGDPSVSIGH